MHIIAKWLVAYYKISFSASTLIKIQWFLFATLHLLNSNSKFHNYVILFFKHHNQLAYVYIQVYTLKNVSILTNSQYTIKQIIVIRPTTKQLALLFQKWSTHPTMHFPITSQKPWKFSCQKILKFKRIDNSCGLFYKIEIENFW